MHDVVTICSGGFDSVTVAYLMAEVGERQLLVSFDYGQRHVVELEYAASAARALGAAHRVIDLTSAMDALPGSALTDPSVDVPDGHYAAESMRATVVPNRNAIMLSIATALAVAEGAHAVVLGVHGGDHFIYPDCRPAFVAAMEVALKLANEGFARSDFEVEAPFLRGDKADVARAAGQLGVPIDHTWSCYRGGAVHCGRCGTCFERREAIRAAGLVDPTTYEAEPDYDVPQGT